MNYLKNYLNALLHFGCFFGITYMAGAATFSGDSVARYYCFLAIVGALAGPVRVALNSKTS